MAHCGLKFVPSKDLLSGPYRYPTSLGRSRLGPEHFSPVSNTKNDLEKAFIFSLRVDESLKIFSSKLPKTFVFKCD